MSRLDQKLLPNSYFWLTPAPFLTFTNSFAKFPQRRAHTHCIISPSIHSYSYLVRALLGFYTYEVGCRPQPPRELLQFGNLANHSTWLQLTCSSYCHSAGSCLQDSCSVLTCHVSTCHALAPFSHCHLPLLLTALDMSSLCPIDLTLGVVPPKTLRKQGIDMTFWLIFLGA